MENTAPHRPLPQRRPTFRIAGTDTIAIAATLRWQGSRLPARMITIAAAFAGAGRRLAARAPRIASTTVSFSGVAPLARV